MRRPRTLSAFSYEEYVKCHTLLATKVAFMMGRKFEEGDWADVYCNSKGIPNRGWSNLQIDVMYQGLGVEHKMLCKPKGRLKDLCGTSPMHPAATRSIRIPTTDADANEVMRVVLSQYAALIGERRKKVQENSPNCEPDMRNGWLLWQQNLTEFLYFEEEMLAPNPDDYFAEWRESGGGSRKSSKNLWVYEKETGHKRYSITTSAGAKIQPYFDVPPPSDPNLYFFQVQGEEIQDGLIRIWITASTERELRSIIGDLSTEGLSLAIVQVTSNLQNRYSVTLSLQERACPIIITSESYNSLTTAFPGVSDEHMIQQLVEHLRGTS